MIKQCTRPGVALPAATSSLARAPSAIAKTVARTGLFLGVNAKPQNKDSVRLGSARMEANAAREVAAGLGAKRALRPPPLYAVDHDTGRLAVAGIAIVPVSRREFLYHVIDPRRRP